MPRRILILAAIGSLAACAAPASSKDTGASADSTDGSNATSADDAKHIDTWGNVSCHTDAPGDLVFPAGPQSFTEGTFKSVTLTGGPLTGLEMDIDGVKQEIPATDLVNFYLDAMGNLEILATHASGVGTFAVPTLNLKAAPLRSPGFNLFFAGTNQDWYATWSTPPSATPLIVGATFKCSYTQSF